MDKPKYSVIVPVYNSEATLHELAERLDRVMQKYESYEILYIDDFSTDQSWKTLGGIKATYDNTRCLRLSRNFGQPSVILCGIRESKADIMLTIDDDLQYPPEEIDKLINAYDPNEKYLLFGVPKQQHQSFINRLGTSLVEFFISKAILEGSAKHLKVSTFRIFTRKKYNHQDYNESRMRSVQVFFTMVSPHLMGSIEVEHQARKKGKSTYSFIKRLKVMIDLIIVLSEFPIYLFIVFFLLSSLWLPAYALLHFLDINISGIIIQSLFWLSISASFLGFVFMFAYLRKVFLGYMGAETYAIWEEA